MAIPRFIQLGMLLPLLKPMVQSRRGVRVNATLLFFASNLPIKPLEQVKIARLTSAAFAALKADGSIVAWGSSSDGGSGVPSGNGYTKIYSTGHAFAALKADGSIAAWGANWAGGTGAPWYSPY
jgi:alpha-tubulin suppressor-like RCC1 family protein